MEKLLREGMKKDARTNKKRRMGGKKGKRGRGSSLKGKHFYQEAAVLRRKKDRPGPRKCPLGLNLRWRGIT